MKIMSTGDRNKFPAVLRQCIVEKARSLDIWNHEQIIKPCKKRKQTVLINQPLHNLFAFLRYKIGNGWRDFACGHVE